MQQPSSVLLCLVLFISSSIPMVGTMYKEECGMRLYHREFVRAVIFMCGSSRCPLLDMTETLRSKLGGIRPSWGCGKDESMKFW
uniref:Uncharacterized protein n=1 Tax=Eptatretus burgeri TaxID=7764 RepID=A0A8C4Q3S4_EPTBU